MGADRFDAFARQIKLDSPRRRRLQSAACGLAAATIAELTGGPALAYQ